MPNIIAAIFVTSKYDLKAFSSAIQQHVVIRE